MLFRGHRSHGAFGHLGGHAGGRAGGLPEVMHIVGMAVLIVGGIAVAAMAQIAVRDWVQREYRNAAYSGLAGGIAVIFVIIAVGWLAMKILRS